MWPILSLQAQQFIFIFIRTGIEKIQFLFIATIREISLILFPQSFLFNYDSLSQKLDLFLFQSSLLSHGVTQSVYCWRNFREKLRLHGVLQRLIQICWILRMIDAEVITDTEWQEQSEHQNWIIGTFKSCHCFTKHGFSSFRCRLLFADETETSVARLHDCSFVYYSPVFTDQCLTCINFQFKINF